MIVYHAYHKFNPCFYIGKTEKSLEHRKNQHNIDAKLSGALHNYFSHKYTE